MADEPITFACTCGKRLKAERERAGQKTHCPDCNQSLQIPTELAIAREQRLAELRKQGDAFCRTAAELSTILGILAALTGLLGLIVLLVGCGEPDGARRRLACRLRSRPRRSRPPCDAVPGCRGNSETVLAPGSLTRR